MLKYNNVNLDINLNTSRGKLYNGSILVTILNFILSILIKFFHFKHSHRTDTDLSRQWELLAWLLSPQRCSAKAAIGASSSSSSSVLVLYYWCIGLTELNHPRFHWPNPFNIFWNTKNKAETVIKWKTVRCYTEFMSIHDTAMRGWIVHDFLSRMQKQTSIYALL